MKKTLIILVVMLGSLKSQAQKISHIETTNSWYYIYDDNGKKIKTVSTSTGELKGYSANFYIIQHGTWIYTYDPTGKKLHTFAVSPVVKSSLWLVIHSRPRKAHGFIHGARMERR